MRVTMAIQIIPKIYTYNGRPMVDGGVKRVYGRGNWEQQGSRVKEYTESFPCFSFFHSKSLSQAASSNSQKNVKHICPHKHRPHGKSHLWGWLEQNNSGQKKGLSHPFPPHYCSTSKYSVPNQWANIKHAWMQTFISRGEWKRQLLFLFAFVVLQKIAFHFVEKIQLAINFIFQLPVSRFFKNPFCFHFIVHLSLLLIGEGDAHKSLPHAISVPTSKTKAHIKNRYDYKQNVFIFRSRLKNKTIQIKNLQNISFAFRRKIWTEGRLSYWVSSFTLLCHTHPKFEI